MGLKFLKWVLPILLELFKSNGRYQNYFKRNKTISLLIIACLISLLMCLFMAEQAIVYGTNSKISTSANVELTEKLETCHEEKKTISSIACP